MTALAGLVRLAGDGDRPHRTAVAVLLGAQQSYGPDHQAVDSYGAAAFGRALRRVLPEDRDDTQPFTETDEGWIAVADVRIDNRGEVASALGCGSDGRIADSNLLFLAYRRWGEGFVERVVGDFALAVWDDRQRLLTLVRDPTGQRPLHYARRDGVVAFASMPRCLHDGVQGAPVDPRQLAAFVADVPGLGRRAFFKDVYRVEPGHIVSITPGGVTTRSYWQMPSRRTLFRNPDDYVSAFREQLDRATRSRLRGAGSTVGAHLSAGIDSSAVAATAARLMKEQGGGVLAYTAAPRIGFDGPVPAGRMADESGHAAMTAALYDNIEHVVLRSRGASPLAHLGRDGADFGEPVGHPCNHLWWTATNEAARDRGIRVMLTGEAGNLSISAGGLAVLADFVRTGHWLRWWREARGLRGGDISLRGVLAASFGPWLPRSAWDALTRFASGGRRVRTSASLLEPRWQSAIQKEADASRGGRPGKDDREARWRLLRTLDPGNFRKGVLGRWGIDERDPTTDRRLVEFCLSLPAEQLLRDGMTRRMARVALADRLPQAVLHGPRGYQFADWYESLDRGLLHREIDDIARDCRGESVVSLSRLRALADGWPPGDWASTEVIGTYRLSLLRALSAARFAQAAGQSAVQEANDI